MTYRKPLQFQCMYLPNERTFFYIIAIIRALRSYVDRCEHLRMLLLQMFLYENHWLLSNPLYGYRQNQFRERY